MRRGGSRTHDDGARVLDPGAAFHVGHVRQLRALQQLRTSSAQLGASAKRLEVQVLDLRTRRSRLEDQARRALAAGREGEAIECLSQSQGIQPQIEDLEARVSQLAELRSRLDASGRRLEASAISMRSAADALPAQSLQAQYGSIRTPSGAGSVARPPGPGGSEGLIQVDIEDGELDQLVQLARDKILWAQARAEAVAELIDRDDEPLPERPGAASDAVSSQVQDRLAELKAELTAGPSASEPAATKHAAGNAGEEAAVDLEAAVDGISEGVQVLEPKAEASGGTQ